jgi:hypothetical protein
LIFLLLLFLFISANEVINTNQPLKGKWDFKLEKIWETGSAGDEPLIQVSTLRIDREGNLFVFDMKTSRFHVFSPQGQFLYSFGKRGEGPGEYRMVFYFFIVGDRVIVPDMNKIHFFETSGKFIRTKTFTGPIIFPRAFVDETRFVYIPSRPQNQDGNDKLELYDLKTGTKKLLGEIKAESVMGATVSRQGGQARINIKDANTTPGVILEYHQNCLFFGKNNRYLIKKTDLNGKELLSFSLSGRKRNKITPEIKRKRLESFSMNGRKIPDDMIKQLMKTMPDECTHFNRIWVDKNGMVYVFVPNLSDQTSQQIDIFSPDGKFLNQANLTLSDGYKLQNSVLTIRDNHLYVFAENQDGEASLIKYRIQLPTG